MVRNESFENGNSSQPIAQDEGLLPENLLQIALQHRWLILYTTLFFLVVAFVYILKATPIYTSTSRLIVESSGPRIIREYEGRMSSSKNYLYTQAELLRSNPIVAPVADDNQIKHFKTFVEVDNLLVYIKSKINVNVGRKDDIITVSLDSPYPEEAARVVNALVESYQDYHSKSKQTIVEKVRNLFQRAKKESDAELTAKRGEILDFTRENGIVSLDFRSRHEVFERLSKLGDALTDAQLATINAKADFEAARNMSSDPSRMKQFAAASSTGGIRIVVNDVETQLRSDLKDTEIELQSVRLHCSEDHPATQAVLAKIEYIKEFIDKQEKEFADAYLEVMRMRWMMSNEREIELAASFDMQRRDARELGIKAVEYSVLDSELKRLEAFTDVLNDRIKELNVTENTGAFNISILEVARVADKPSKPRKAKIMALALILGLMLGSGLAFVRDWMDYRLRSVEEVSAVLGVPVLGVVPAMPKKQNIVERGQKVYLESKSVTAESYRTIRTAVFFGVPKGGAKSILVTSPAPGDGKTTLASNLAIAMAQAGQKVLILDADFRKPMQHNIFEFENDMGLSGVLAGTLELEDAVRSTNIEGLDLLTCGADVPNPSEVLNSEAFEELLGELCQRYDRVILDSPPVAPVADSQILSAISDVTILVLRAEKSTRKLSQQARDGLISVGGHLLGVVVNDVSRKRGFYGSYSSYGTYGSYGHYGEQDYYGNKEKEKAKVV